MTADKVRSSLNAIKDDVAKIADAQGQLSDSQKKQVQKANDAFKSKVKALAGDLGQSVSIEEAAKQLTATSPRSRRPTSRRSPRLTADSPQWRGSASERTSLVSARICRDRSSSSLFC